MKQLGVLFLVVSPPSFAAEYLELVESKVYETSGSAEEISKRGELCIAQHVRNDPIRISDSADNLLGLGLAKRSTGEIPGGAVIVKADPAAGTVIATVRTPWSQLLTKNFTQSTLTFLAKEGRFKIQFTSIETLQQNTGYAENNGFVRQGKWIGSSWEKVQKALLETAEKVATCTAGTKASNDW